MKNCHRDREAKPKREATQSPMCYRAAPGPRAGSPPPAYAGTIPSVQPNAATTLARAPRDSPAGSAMSTPVAGRGDDQEGGEEEVGGHWASGDRPQRGAAGAGEARPAAVTAIPLPSRIKAPTGTVDEPR